MSEPTGPQVGEDVKDVTIRVQGETIKRLRQELKTAQEARGRNGRGETLPEEARREIEEGAAALQKTSDALAQVGAQQPLVYASVVRVIEPTPESLEPRPENFRPGTEVIMKDGDDNPSALGSGLVVGPDPKKAGNVLVNFGKKQKSCFVGEKPEEVGELEIVPKRFVVVKKGGETLELGCPIDLAVKQGDQVKMGIQTHQVVDRTDPLPTGPVVMVRRVISPENCEIEYNGQTLVVSSGNLPAPVEKDDRVVLDQSASVIVQNLGKGETEFKDVGPTGVTWDDVAAQDEAKATLRKAIENPVRFKVLREKLRRKAPNGILLLGPPGCGKTLLGKAAATAMAELYGKTGGFLYVKGPEVLIKWVGDSEAKIRWLFAVARRFHEQNGYPLIIFIDEAEAILRARGSGISSDVLDSVVPAFLAEMSGVDKSGAFVMLATNRPEMLDEAVVREGRIDFKVLVGRPDRDGAEKIFAVHLRNVPFKNCTAEELARLGAEELFAEKYAYYEMQWEGGATTSFGLAQLASGAMIEAIVQQALDKVENRCIEAGNETGDGEGLISDDIILAVRDLYRQNSFARHERPLQDHIQDQDGRITGYTRLRQAQV